MNLPTTSDPQFDRMAQLGAEALELAEKHRVKRNEVLADLRVLAFRALHRSTDASLTELARQMLAKYQ